jgi:hypothetical protein
MTATDHCGETTIVRMSNNLTITIIISYTRVNSSDDSIVEFSTIGEL